MARTAFTPINSTGQGTVLTAAAAVDATNGNQFTNPTGRAILEVTNAAASNINVTITTVASYNVAGTSGSISYAVADSIQVVQNGTSKVFGPFDKTLYNDTNGNVLVDYSSGTSITARVIEMLLA